MTARHIHISGTVQGVGFRPFVFRLAHEYALCGWVQNTTGGVEIHIEGEERAIEDFRKRVQNDAPEAAQILTCEVKPVPNASYSTFEIRSSAADGRKDAGISPDLAVCKDCLQEVFQPENPRYHYPYITCTHCGPRYSIVLGLPYDRAQTTMRDWELCPRCKGEYENPLDRRFRAQPVACSDCGPHYVWSEKGVVLTNDVLPKAAEYLALGKILAIKGLGGYHLVCDAENEASVRLLRERKFRKDKPFAVMVESLEATQKLALLNESEMSLLTSSARPIVLVSVRTPTRLPLQDLAPDNSSLGIMLPYTPLQYLLFEELRTRRRAITLVMTSANRSSEPLCYRDDEALERLSGIADAFVIGERPIARRVEDSVVQNSSLGTVFVRRSRGYAPAPVVQFPGEFSRNSAPVLALGADMKNTMTLVVEGQALMSQFIGDLAEAEVLSSFRETAHDLLQLYDLSPKDVVIAHDAHPGYVSTQEALAMPSQKHIPIQHHKAHIASVLAERGEFERCVVGIALDGTGWGEDGTIWGGEAFVGSLSEGFVRKGHLRTVDLPGGDAAALHPVQAASGFLAQLAQIPTFREPDFMQPPFDFPDVFRASTQLVHKKIRLFQSSSAGRLFDAVAALLGFTRPVTFEGQAAMWLEHCARQTQSAQQYQMPCVPHENGIMWDWQPLLVDIVRDVERGCEKSAIARGFHAAFARAVVEMSSHLAQAENLTTTVLSGGVFQNILLVNMIANECEQNAPNHELWVNNRVPPNDGGVSLGQAALALVV